MRRCVDASVGRLKACTLQLRHAALGIVSAASLPRVSSQVQWLTSISQRLSTVCGGHSTFVGQGSAPLVAALTLTVGCYHVRNSVALERLAHPRPFCSPIVVVFPAIHPSDCPLQMVLLLGTSMSPVRPSPLHRNATRRICSPDRYIHGYLTLRCITIRTPPEKTLP